MYKVIIIDDETHILKVLKNSVEWNKFNMEVAEIFDNSLKALDYFDKTGADLVITDISMPQLDGITLIEKMKEINDNTIFIILSAYSDFNYAVQALKLSVLDYILKPIDFQKLHSSLEEAEKRLTINAQTSNNDFEYLKFTDITIKFLNSNELSADEYLNYLKSNGFEADTQTPSTFLMKIEMLNLPDYLETAWKHSIDRLYFTINYFLKTLSDDKLLFIPLTLIFNKLTFLVITKDSKFDSSSVTDEFLKNFTKNISDCIKLDLDAAIIKSFKNLSEAQKVASFFVDLPKNEINEASNYNPIGQAIKYIHDHYTEDISLTDISRNISLTPYYFCRLFKKETGETLVDFINRVRIENARNLIVTTNDSITSIYKTVGFNAKNHFYKLFKDYYGQTPQSYRKEHSKQ